MPECTNCMKDLKGQYAIDETLLDLLLEGNTHEITNYLQKSVNPQTFEIIPSDKPVDFTYSHDDKDLEKYTLLFLALFLGVFTKYQYKSADYAIAHIDEDIKKLNKSLLSEVDKLNKTYIENASKTLMDAGILKENISKVSLEKIAQAIDENKPIPTDLIKNKSKNVFNTQKILKYNLLEQKTKLEGITNELSSDIKSKAYFLKSRSADDIFDVKSNFRRAVERTKTMSESGFKNVKGKAVRHSQIFLYGDPDAYWVTAHDSRVCIFCRTVEAASPMPLSWMNFWPMHPKCGQRCRIVLVDDIQLTDLAMSLMAGVAIGND